LNKTCLHSSEILSPHNCEAIRIPLTTTIPAQSNISYDIDHTIKVSFSFTSR